MFSVICGIMNKNKQLEDDMADKKQGTLGKAKKAYSETLGVLNKNKDLCVFDVKSLEFQSERHLFGLKLKEVYGFEIDVKRIASVDWFRINDYLSLGRFGEKYGRTVSWSDDDQQPSDELLLLISFPTGAYIFGDDYPRSLFNDLFDELKTYGPKYSDSNNQSLYFSLKQAGPVFNAFDGIMDKYYKINKGDFKSRKIKRLKEELEKLESLG